jgi:hypothetical protein
MLGQVGKVYNIFGQVKPFKVMLNHVKSRWEV